MASTAIAGEGRGEEHGRVEPDTMPALQQIRRPLVLIEDAPVGREIEDADIQRVNQGVLAAEPVLARRRATREVEGPPQMRVQGSDSVRYRLVEGFVDAAVQHADHHPGRPVLINRETVARLQTLGAEEVAVELGTDQILARIGPLSFGSLPHLASLEVR